MSQTKALTALPFGIFLLDVKNFSACSIRQWMLVYGMKGSSEKNLENIYVLKNMKRIVGINERGAKEASAKICTR